MKRSSAYLLLFVLILSSSISSSAQVKKLNGYWIGDIQIQKARIEMIFYLNADETEGYKTTLDIPAQSVKGLKVENTIVSNDSIEFHIPAILGVFKGSIVSSDSIAGSWTQGTFKLPLGLKKQDKPAEIKRPQTPKPPFPYHIEEVEYMNKKSGLKLAGTLTSPKNKKDVPCVILITGSGGQDRDESLLDHKSFWVIADYLTRKDIAVLRVDDRGIGGSEGNLGDATSNDLATDVLAGIQFLETKDHIDQYRIGLIGHSEGGLIAPIVANASNKVAFIVMLAGPGISGDQILIEQTVLGAKALGLNEGMIAQREFIITGLVDIMKNESDTLKKTERLQQLLSGGMYNMMDSTRKQMIDNQVKTYNSNWFSYFINYDPYPALSKVQCPVLALIGEKDTQVPAKINLEAIEKALTEGGNTNFLCVELTGLNHLFQQCDTGSGLEYGKIEETISPRVLEMINDWIQEVCSQ